MTPQAYRTAGMGAFRLHITPFRAKSAKNAKSERASAGIARQIGLLAIFAVAAVAQTTGSLQGTLQDEKGPMTNAEVAVVPLPSTGQTNLSLPGAGKVAYAKTDSKGNYSVPGLAPGSYTVCIRDFDAQRLDPCHWSAGTKVTVAAGKATTQAMQATSAATLKVHVSDPQKLTDSTKKVNDIMVAVVTPSGKLAPMRLASDDPTGGKVFQLAVPKGTYKVFVMSTTLEVADSSGNLDPKDDGKGNLAGPTTGAAVNVDTGIVTVELTITGTRPAQTGGGK